MKILVTEEQLKRIVETLAEDISDVYSSTPRKKIIRLLDLDPESDFDYGGKIYEIGDFGKMLLNIEKNEPIDSEYFRILSRYGREFVENKDNLEYDIESINTIKDLRNLLMGVTDLEDLSELDEDDVEYYYQDNSLIIAKPLTEKGAALLSKGTSWPIALGKYSPNEKMRQYENEFNELNAQGPIYVIIQPRRKGSDDKYMVHFESGTIIDDQDREITLKDLIDKSYHIEDFFMEVKPDEVN